MKLQDFVKFISKNNNKERVGFLVLGVLLILSFSSIFILPALMKPNKITSSPYTEKELDSIVSLLNKQNKYPHSGTNQTRHKKWSEFDKKKEKIPSNPKAKLQKKALPIPKIELNRCDSTNLYQTLKINSNLAARIIKYRNLLGGYNSFNQLTEVYGIDSILPQKVKQHYIIDTLLINKIPLNTANYATLIKHPYINKYQASAILKYRTYNHHIKNINELQQNNILSDTELTRIKPYLSLD